MSKRTKLTSVGFNLYIGAKSGQYYKCYIFDSVKRMQGWNNHDGQRSGLYNKAAAVVRLFHTWKKRGNHWSRANCIGSITFAVTHVSAAIVAHEMNHAALFWFKERFKNYLKLNKSFYFEKLATADERLTRQFWAKWYELEKEGKLKRMASKRLVK